MTGAAGREGLCSPVPEGVVRSPQGGQTGAEAVKPRLAIAAGPGVTWTPAAEAQSASLPPCLGLPVPTSGLHTALTYFPPGNCRGQRSR